MNSLELIKPGRMSRDPDDPKFDLHRTGAPAVIRIRIVRGIRVEIRNTVVATVDAPIQFHPEISKTI